MLGKKPKTAAAALALLAGLGGTALAEVPVVTIYGHENPGDAELMERIEAGMAAQGMEIDIELVGLSSSGYADALSLRLLSGEIPDIIYFQGGDTEFANQGILEDLRPWIAEATHLQGALWPHNVERLENYPYLLYVFPARTKSAVMRQDWLDEAGGQAPQTVDDWTELLRTLSSSDLDGNGENDTFGVTLPGNTSEMDSLFNRAFGISATWMQNAEGEWIHSRVSDQERDKLAYYQSLYAEGLLDPEFVTTNWELKEDKFYTGRAGIVMGTAGLVVDIYRSKMQQVNPGTELVMLDPPAGVDQGLIAVDVAKESRGFAIHARSDAKEAAVAVLDFLVSPEGQFIDRMGVEGEHYIRDGDSFQITEAMGTWYPRFFVANPDYWSPPVDLLSPVAQGSLAQGAQYFTPDNAFVWPSDLATDVDAAEQYYRTSVFRFVSGEWSMDQWDDYVQGWYDAGGERMTEHARTVLQ